MSATGKKTSIRTLTLLAVFTAIEIIFCFTPLGSLPLGPGIVATLAHIPVLAIAVSMGRKPALYMGGVMGVCSLIWWSTIGIAYPSAFAFTPFAQYGNIFSLIICLLPRALFPVIASLLFDLFSKRINSIAAAAIAGTLGTLCHSAMVLGLIYICFIGNSAVSANLGDSFIGFIIAWAGVNAIAETIVAAVVCGAVTKPLIKLSGRKSA